MTAYWKALGALAAGLVVLIVVAIFTPSDKVLLGIAGTSVAAALGALVSPKNSR